ncbi:hypothetical protein [Arcanobacterium hippocoleae]|uniref:Uncharacterized protein n=1 Tax=Arcanobacterium hippocoleae TaxID=149017 RepID=A0ABU1T1K6_9ACTO|nr:hypothetical protein [Arcanobacterium hippocoleae]MDR6939250.1 hypothetical protein [Arcanobacterium hippocoleae]
METLSLSVFKQLLRQAEEKSEGDLPVLVRLPDGEHGCVSGMRPLLILNSDGDGDLKEVGLPSALIALVVECVRVEGGGL